MGDGEPDPALRIIDLLAERFSFAEISELAARGACDHCRTGFQVAQIQQLCAFGQRLLDLDAEDFGEADSATDSNVDHSVADRIAGDAVPADLVARSRLARMPQSPHEHDRGALGTLRPAFALILEVIAVRWLRRETSALVAALHIASEYLPMLVWQPILGHAGDPARMRASVGGPASRWDRLDDHECPHTKPEKSACERALRVSAEPDTGWRGYLDRQHSAVSSALAMCATTCRTRCSVITRYPASVQEQLAERCRVADEFTASAVIKLRHSAPVGHGFGVPSRSEVLAAWTHTREGIGRHEPAVRTDDGFVLPGLPSLVTALAGAPVAPDTILAETVRELRDLLD